MDLLHAANPVSRERAWSKFLASYSRLILHVSRSALVPDYDTTMDRYTYVLEALRRDDFRRLRSFVGDGRGKFTTWLTVVVRRLCLDHRRHRYGRVRSSSCDTATAAPYETRRRLADLLVTEIDMNELRSAKGDGPEERLRAVELGSALAEAVGKLPSRQRLLLAMRFEDDLSARQIAEVMGFPSPFHVYRGLNAVLRSLRQTLRRRGIEDSTP